MIGLLSGLLRRTTDVEIAAADTPPRVRRGVRGTARPRRISRCASATGAAMLVCAAASCARASARSRPPSSTHDPRAPGGRPTAVTRAFARARVAR